MCRDNFPVAIFFCMNVFSLSFSFTDSFLCCANAFNVYYVPFVYFCFICTDS